MSWKSRTFLACLIVGIPAVAAADALAPADVKFDDMSVSQSLTGQPGDPVKGRKVFADRKLGNCLACHAVADQKDQLFHGEVGPELDGAADRWSEGELRAIVADAKMVFSEETVMPGFYSLNVGADVRKNLVGKTILSAQDVEDVVAYLATLKE
ncbi:MAG: sulfur oxidation c-type cytochrome SoxX [Rhodospirillales bacterium]|nr:sulfur oxidation c-type cytochrome SoxX [Rhodospirillales bacterium]